MCGICGIYDLSDPVNLLSEIKRMVEMVQHRGPDDSGWLMVRRNGEATSDYPGPSVSLDFAEDGRSVLALGHRRLSIIDLSAAGHQPMCDASGRYWIVYNGEVYNYLELRQSDPHSM